MRMAKDLCKSFSLLEITEDNSTEVADADGDCDSGVTPADLCQNQLPRNSGQFCWCYNETTRGNLRPARPDPCLQWVNT